MPIGNNMIGPDLGPVLTNSDQSSTQTGGFVGGNRARNNKRRNNKRRNNKRRNNNKNQSGG